MSISQSSRKLNFFLLALLLLVTACTLAKNLGKNKGKLLTK